MRRLTVADEFVPSVVTAPGDAGREGGEGELIAECDVLGVVVGHWICGSGWGVTSICITLTLSARIYIYGRAQGSGLTLSQG